MTHLLHDVRYAIRSIQKAPGFAAVVILTLALGIGANSAIFSAVDAVLLHAAPYPHGELLVWLGESTAKAPGISVTWVNYQAWKSQNHSFDQMAIYEGTRLTLTGRGDPLLTPGMLVSSDFFRLLGAQPELGRSFSEDEDRPGADRTVVLSHNFWATKLGGDPNILGTVLNLNKRPYRVIGIAPAHFQSLAGEDYYLPIGIFEGAATDRGRHGSMRVLGLLKPGVILDSATADLDRVMQQLGQSDPGPEADHRVYAAFYAERTTRTFRPTLVVVMAAVGMVLLLACANVASLVLARGAARTGEIAIRAAIGAGRWRLVRQLLTENLVLAAAGGAAGLGLAFWLVRLIAAAGPRDIPRLAQTSLNPQVLLFTAAITLLTGLLVGLAPVWLAGRLDLVTAMKDISRNTTGARRGAILRNMLVIAEIAITLVLAFASSLLIRSLAAARNRSTGFDAGHVLALELVLPGSSYRSPQSIETLFERLSADLRALPGVSSVGSVFCPPAAGDCRDWFYSIADRPAPARGDVPVALMNAADAGYFHTMQIPIREGRDFAETDTAAAPGVAIVNEAFARKWFPREAATGHRIKVGGPYLEGGTLEIVGVSGNIGQLGLDAEPAPEIFLPRAQDGANSMVIMIRSGQNPANLVSAMRRTVSVLDPSLPIRKLRPFEESLAEGLARRRFGTVLLALFAGLAMLLAAVGIFGLLNYWVSVREGEIALRMVLGASVAKIAGWTGTQALRLAAAGIALGSAGAWMASRWLETLVFGVSPRNLWLLSGSAGAVIMLALLAAAVPVWRAGRVEAGGDLRQL